MKHVYDKGFVYTPAAKHQTADYLKERFAQIRAEIAERQKEAELKVSPIKQKARTA